MLIVNVISNTFVAVGNSISITRFYIFVILNIIFVNMLINFFFSLVSQLIFLETKLPSLSFTIITMMMMIFDKQ